MKEAYFYHKASGQQVICDLCPNACKIGPENVGICNGRKNIEGVLYALNYGETISVNIDPVEKKPLFHYYPGQNILSLGANSCNFQCSFCQNYQSSQFECPTRKITPLEILEILKKYNLNLLAFTYTEPFTWYEFIYDTAIYLKNYDIKIVLVTNGFVNKEPLEKLLPYIDALNIDLKSSSDDFYKNLCHGSLEPVLETISTCHAKAWIELTNLIITGENDQTSVIQGVIDFVADLDPTIPLHISRYYPQYKLDKEPTSHKTLELAYAQAKEKLFHVYLGNIVTESESDTFCSECNNLLIKRTGYTTEIKNLSHNKCNKCNTILAGRFN